MNQEHTKFKIFTKEFSAESSIDNLLEEIVKWASENNVGPKSIGVEYLEGAKNIVMSVGYREDENYSVALDCMKIDTLTIGADYEALEKKMTEAAASKKDIICHELFITGTGDFYMVFMGIK